MFLHSLRMGGDGMNSAAGSSKQSDSMSDSGKSNGVSNGGSNSLPYDVLSRDLTQAKELAQVDAYTEEVVTPIPADVA